MGYARGYQTLHKLAPTCCKKNEKRLKVILDTWHGTPDTWHLTNDTWHLTYNTWNLQQLKQIWYCSVCGIWLDSVSNKKSYLPSTPNLRICKTFAWIQITQKDKQLQDLLAGVEAMIELHMMLAYEYCPTQAQGHLAGPSSSVPLVQFHRDHRGPCRPWLGGDWREPTQGLQHPGVRQETHGYQAGPSSSVSQRP